VARRRRWIRVAVVSIAAYLALAVVAHGAGLVAVLVARVWGDGPHDGGVDVAGVRNFRAVDQRVWLGAQPDDDSYRELARRGVTAVVDLRTGADDDPRKDDPGLLRRLGVAHHHLPVPDGHAPTPADVEAFLRVVDEADGVVFVHCGGGVGRTTSLQAAYLAAAGNEPSVVDLAAVGPMTLEQLWVVATARAERPGRSNAVVRRVSEMLDAPRRGLSRLRALP
jgi:protein tyrosine phosphatase (PTP) superfamily phosphohydrolase (DUF442 family)